MNRFTLTALIAAVATLLVLVTWFGWRLSVETENGVKLRGELNKLNVQLLDKSKTENLALQGKCAEQAGKMFHTLGFKDQQPGPNFDLYQNHYNPALGKCFVSIESTNTVAGSGRQAINKVLLDAFEQREYAEYFWLSSDTKKYWEVKPSICKLTESNDATKTCDSDEEYKAFVAKYVE